MYGVVYLILNKVNGRKYVGQTIQLLKVRFNEHARKKDNMLISKLIDMPLSSLSYKMQGVRNFTERDIVKLEEFFGKSADYLLECNF